MGKIEEENLKKLAATNLPTSFVKKNNGEWDHQKWLDFCAFLEQKGYCPINLDQVGLLLEKKKAEFFEKCSCGCGSAAACEVKEVKPAKAAAGKKKSAK